MPTAIELFAGAGGGGLALKQAGFDVVYANDFDAAACETYRHNLGEIECADIRDLNFAALPAADFLLGGFPCQPFSILNKYNAQKYRDVGSDITRHSDKSQLYTYMIAAIKAIQPLIFVGENVRDIRFVSKGSAFRTIMAAFADTPYDFAAYEVNFADYGLPQARRRILFIGSRIPFEFPRKVKPHTPCGVAFLDPVDGLPNSAQRGGGNKRYDYFGRFVREGATGYNTSKRLWTYGGGNNKLDLRKPARTILSNVRGYYLPTGEKITFRHGARLQGFPDDFEFLGNDHDVGKQIGNAIPPVGFLPFAQKFYEAIQRHKGSQVQ